MPTYDYVCGACGHAFEHFQSMSDKPLKTCPRCAKRKLVRQVGAGAGVIFRGSGWYATDYRKAAPPAAPPSGKDAGPGCGEKACGGDPGSCAAGGGKKE
jgi:putative FmdB family regulatory protein